MLELGLWRLLLPLSPRGTLLFVGDASPDDLLEVAGELSRIHYAHARGGVVTRMFRAFEEAGSKCLSPLRMNDVVRLPLSDQSVDAVVLNPGWGGVFGFLKPALVLGEIRRLLKPDGAALIVTVAGKWPSSRNPFPDSERMPARAFFRGSKRACGQGFSVVRQFAVVDTREGIDVYRVGGQGTVGDSIPTDSELWKDAVRRRLVATGRAVSFLPSLLFRGSGADEPFVSLVQEIGGSYPNQGLGEDLRDRCRLSGAGNLYFSMEVDGRRGRVEVAIRPRTRTRELHNVEMLESISAAESLAESSRIPVPRIFGRGVVGPYPYVVEEHLPGVTLLEWIGADRTRRKNALASGARVLRRIEGLRLGAEEDRVAREKRWSALLDRFAAVEGFFATRPQELAVYRRLCERTRTALSRALESFPLVFGHGDFGPQNILVHPDSGEVVGVIDWDLADETAFPGVDLLHLAVALHWKTEDISLVDSLIDVLWPAMPSWTADRDVSRSLEDGNVTLECFPYFGVLTWLHWIAPHLTTDRRKDRDWIDANVIAFTRSSPVLDLAGGAE